MKYLRSLVAALLVFGLASPATAQTFPKFTGLVVDAANVLPPAVEADLTAKLEALQKDTKRQLVVVTVPDLQGYPIDDYGYRLGRDWAVGLKDANNGVLLLIAPNESPGSRGPGIEVGYGLEPVITDVLAATIIQQKMMPILKANGDVAGAMTAGTDALVAQLRASPEEAQAKVDAAIAEFDKAQPRARQRGGGGVPFGLIFWGLLIAFVGLSFIRRRGGNGRRYHRDGGGDGVLPVILWSIANEIGNSAMRGGGGGSSWGGGGGSDSGGGGWGGGGFSGGGGGSFGGGGASGSW